MVGFGSLFKEIDRLADLYLFVFPQAGRCYLIQGEFRIHITHTTRSIADGLPSCFQFFPIRSLSLSMRPRTSRLSSFSVYSSSSDDSNDIACDTMHRQLASDCNGCLTNLYIITLAVIQESPIEHAANWPCERISLSLETANNSQVKENNEGLSPFPPSLSIHPLPSTCYRKHRSGRPCSHHDGRARWASSRAASSSPRWFSAREATRAQQA